MSRNLDAAPPSGGQSTVAQRAGYVDLAGRRDMDKTVADVGPMPRILCWNCRKLTPFEVDHCQHCGTAFAGGTGGAYGSDRPITTRAISVPRERTKSSKSSNRNISQIFEDLQRVHEVSSRSRGRPKGRRREQELYVHLYQCPACSRFVSKEATDCVCGVRFASMPADTFACPECGAHVPAGDRACPVCGIGLSRSRDHELIVYSCPRCGTQVASDQARCSCGVWFAD